MKIARKLACFAAGVVVGWVLWDPIAEAITRWAEVEWPDDDEMLRLDLEGQVHPVSGDWTAEQVIDAARAAAAARLAAVEESKGLHRGGIVSSRPPDGWLL